MDIQESIDSGEATIVKATGMEMADVLALYKSDLAKIEEAVKRAEADFYTLTGRAQTLRDIIAFHENANP